MTVRLLTEPPAVDSTAEATEDAGLGALATDRGNLPLEAVDVTASITGLTARVRLSQSFRNPHAVPLEATYVFPLPDRAAVTAMRMEADGRVVDGVLKERGQARADYQQAISEGRRASIAEEERPDVFTMRVGNILPGEVVTVRLTLDQPLPYADGEATFRFPLVVAPRYVPGAAIGGEQVGSGWAPDTDATPDASRISPPVLLPGFPNPVRLSIGVDIDPGGLPLAQVRSSLHAVRAGDGDGQGDAGGRTRVSIEPGERADRDFVLRLAYGLPDETAQSLVLVPDADEPGEGTFQLTVLPPNSAAPPRPRDVVLVLDRSGSMGGWKMVAARRAAARIVDTLTDRDRFAVLAFDHTVERPAGLAPGLVAGTDRNRFRAVEHLARMEARGGTEMLQPLTEAVSLLTESANDRVLVLVTDGQVGNEDQLVASLSAGLTGLRVHTVGIDRAVNAGFLTRLAVLGGGRCELVESEDRLDKATEHIHRRICQPLVTDLALSAAGLTLVDDTVAPARLPALFPGVPLVLTGRWRGSATGTLTLRGHDAAARPWSVDVRADGPVEAPAVPPIWGRAHLRDLEDRYLVAGPGTMGELERRIVATSLRCGVLCRFTAYVAVDTRVVTDGAEPHQVTQPVEPASGWDMLAEGAPQVMGMAAAAPTARLASHAMERAKAAPPPGMPARDAAGSYPVATAGGGGVPPAPPAFGAPPVASAPAPGGPVPAGPAQAAPIAPLGGSVGGGRGGTPDVFGAPVPGLSRRARKAAGQEARPAVLDPLAWARTQAADELRRLNSAEPGAGRLALLQDLGNRLHAMVSALAAQGVPANTGTVEELRSLAEALQAATPATLDQLWRRAVTVLTAFAGAITPPARTQGPPPKRPTFWKR